MPIQSVNYILTAGTIWGSLVNYWTRQLKGIRESREVILPLDVNAPAVGLPVNARIYRGQWIADCECNGASYVDPSDPRFFCFSCGNRSNNGQPRPVIFPNNREEIERAILDRPVDDMAGITDAERAGASKPLIFLEDGRALWREWLPGETLEDLLQQQTAPLKAWHKST